MNQGRRLGPPPPSDPESKSNRPIWSTGGTRSEVAWRLLAWFWLPLGSAMLVVVSVLICCAATCAAIVGVGWAEGPLSFVRQTLVWVAGIGFGVMVGLLVARVLAGPLR